MSAPMNEPAGDDSDDTPPDPTFEACGTYVEPVSVVLPSDSGGVGGPAPVYGWTRDNLGEDSYTTGRAGGADVDRHINTDPVHGPFYGQAGPKPYPV